MRKLLFLFFLLPSLSYSQFLPSYPDVLHHFYSSHNTGSLEPAEEFRFAKMKDGWYVQVVDRMTEEVKNSYLLWSTANVEYIDIDTYAGKMGEDYVRQVVFDQLGQFNTYNSYGYERCRYFGYNGWERDMIDTYGNQFTELQNDTLLEGLARAYSSYANSFLWSNYRGNEDDPYHRPLALLEKPSTERTDSAIYYFKKGIEVYSLLAGRNPSYRTLVGNTGMKYFNELVHAWHQMVIARNEEAGRQFFSQIKPNPAIHDMAHNYLEGLAPNSILFTYGDNDTYPLLYVQQAENFRPDVIVVNMSLLGLPRYINLLQVYQGLSISTSPGVYGEEYFQYFRMDETVSNPARVSLDQFIRNMKSFNISGTETEVPTYSQKQINLPVDLKTFEKISNQKNLSSRIQINLPENYMTLDQFMVLDILNNNLYKRPVYFTSTCDLLPGSLQLDGLVYQLLPLDSAHKKTTESIELNKSENYIQHIYKPVPSNQVKSGISPSLDPAINLFMNMAGVYLSKGQKEKAAALLSQLTMDYNNSFPFDPALSELAFMMFQAGNDGQGMQLLEQYAQGIFELYQKPSAILFYIDREMARKLVSDVHDKQKKEGRESRIINNIMAKLDQ